MSVADFEDGEFYNDSIDEIVRKIIQDFCEARELNTQTAIKLYKYAKYNVGSDKNPYWKELDLIDKMDEIIDDN